MADSQTRRVAADLLSEPHISGRRVSVRQVATLVETKEQRPESVADRFDLDVADVYHALAYYHDHPAEMSKIERNRASAIASFSDTIERPASVNPEDA